MAKLVASTWNRRRTTLPQWSSNTAQKLVFLGRAVEACAARVAAAGFPADGLIKGIFAAPEYLFSAKFAGLDYLGVQHARPVREKAHDTMLQAVLQLSKRFPRILIVPGTMAWKKPLDKKLIQKHLDYYYKGTNKATESDVFEIIKIEYRFNANTKQLVSEQDRALYFQTQGAPMPVLPVTDHFLNWLKTNDPATLQFLIDSTLGRVQSHVLDIFGPASVKTAEGRLGAASEMMFNTAWGFLNGQVVFEYNKQGNFHEEFGSSTLVFVPGAKSGVVQIEEITFGFEICLDHNISALSKQARAGKQLDIQVILSDSVDFNPANYRVREGGYMVHSSTVDSLNGVWQVNGGQRVLAPDLGSDSIDGSDLDHYEIELDLYDPFALGDTFMADLPGRESKVKPPPAKKWPQVAPAARVRTTG